MAFSGIANWLHLQKFWIHLNGIERFSGIAVGLRLQKFWIILAESSVSMALERRFRQPDGAKLALERNFGQPDGAKLALERRFGQLDGAKLDLEWRFGQLDGAKFTLEPHFGRPDGDKLTLERLQVRLGNASWSDLAPSWPWECDFDKTLAMRRKINVPNAQMIPS